MHKKEDLLDIEIELQAFIGQHVQDEDEQEQCNLDIKTLSAIADSEGSVLYCAYSDLAARTYDGAGYWSNTFGWAGADSADVFSENERETLNVPTDGKWRALTSSELTDRIKAAHANLKISITASSPENKLRELLLKMRTLSDAAIMTMLPSPASKDVTAPEKEVLQVEDAFLAVAMEQHGYSHENAAAMWESMKEDVVDAMWSAFSIKMDKIPNKLFEEPENQVNTLKP